MFKFHQSSSLSDQTIQWIIKYVSPVLFAASVLFLVPLFGFRDAAFVIFPVGTGFAVSYVGRRHFDKYWDSYQIKTHSVSPTTYFWIYATLHTIPFVAAVAGFVFCLSFSELDAHVTSSMMFLITFAALMACLYRFESRQFRYYVSGVSVLDGDQAKRRAKNVGHTQGVPFGGIEIPYTEATKHFLVTGCSGSGKSVTIRKIVKSIAARVLEQGAGQVVLYDSKKNTLKFVQNLAGRNIPVLDLHPYRNTGCAWNIAQDIRSPQDIEALTNILLPNSQSGKDNEFFENMNRDLMQAVIGVLNVTCPGNWTLRDLYWILISEELLLDVLKLSAEGEKVAAEIEKVGDPRTLSNIRFGLRAKLRRYATIAATTEYWRKKKRMVSLTKWAQKGRGFLILGAEKSSNSGLEAINQAMIWIMSREWLKGDDSPHDPKRYLVLDEIQSAGRQDALPGLLNEGREKGVCAVFGFQDISSMYALYGQPMTDAMVGQFGHKAFLRLQGHMSLNWASKMLGDVEEVSVSYTSGSSDSSQGSSTSSSQSRQLGRRQAVSVGDIKTLPPTNIQNGMTGYYDSPEMGVWKHHYNSHELWPPGEQNSYNTPIDHTEISSQLLWLDEDDFKRLGLRPIAPNQDDRVLGEEIEERDALPDVRSIWLEDEDDQEDEDNDEEGDPDENDSRSA